MGVRENKVEKYLDKEVVALGGITRKWVSPSQDGVPDRIVIVRGLVIFVEVKTVDGELTSNQEREHTRLIDCGAIVKTVYGEGGVDDFIKWLKRVSTTPSSSI
jgi:hypothetical protein|tara:strand:+ start:1763 stop:2071 length:309 start_codon:yes stop_codon:yes gene_type:complete